MRLHDKVAFDEPTSVIDDYGGTESGWTEVYACRASIRYLSGKETVQSSRLDGKQVVEIYVRESASARAIDTNYRVRDVVAGVAYNIRSGSIETSDRKYLKFTAESGVAI